MNRILLPVPQKAEFKNADIVLGTPGVSGYHIVDNIKSNNPIIANAKGEMIDRLTGLINCPPACDGVSVVFELGEAPEGLKYPDQGYSIVSGGDKITVTGFGTAGFYYAAKTFMHYLELKENKLVFPKVKLFDYPDFEARIMFFESRYGTNIMTKEDWFEVIDRCTELKINKIMLSLYCCWVVQYDGRVSEHVYVPIEKYPKLKNPVVERYYSPLRKKWVDFEHLPPIFEQDFLGEIVKYGKSKGIMVYPRWNSYGHNTLIPDKYPEVSAVDENGNPTLAGFCTSTPKTYEMLFEIYDEIYTKYMKPYGVDTISLSLDEVSSGYGFNADDPKKKRSAWCSCPECAKHSRMELYMNHALKIMKHLKELGIKSIIMADDMLRDKNGIPEGEISLQAKFRNLLLENDLLDVVVLDFWCYGSTWDEMRFTTTQPDVKMRKLICPWNGYYFWTILTPSAGNAQIMTELGLKENCDWSICYAAWYRGYKRNDFAFASYSWNNKGTGTPEDFGEAFAAYAFPNEFEKAKRAFMLMDRIFSATRIHTEGEKYAFKLNFVLNVLSYYFYSYVNPKLPYPRHFPGEAVEKLLSERKVFEEIIYDIAAMAKEAKELFTELSESADGDFEYAGVMIYEADNYLVLVNDFIALLRMYDLTQSVKPLTAEAAAKIKALAKERKQARLSIMARFEMTREDYMLAPILRNHSIFMQYFADLEGYIASTPVKELKLDFTDNTHFASKAFMLLR